MKKQVGSDIIRKSFGYRMKKYRWLLLMAVVPLVYIFVFHYIPIFWGILISLKDMKVGSTIGAAPWVGLDTYREIMRNPEILKLLKNTLRISILSLVFGFLPPIFLTILIFDLRSAVYKKLAQTLVYIPHFFSWVIIYGIVFAFFSGQGFVNGIITGLGGRAVDFLTSRQAFVPLLVGSNIWKECGWSTILYFAALTGVNPDLYDAAKIDGAGPLARIRAVTLPAMLPVITFSLIMAVGGILGTNFEQILLFYNPAVYEVGDVLDTWVYRVGLGKMQYSIGSAVGMMKAVVGVTLTVIANAVSRKVAGRSLF